MLEANSNTGVGITRWKNFKPIQDEIYEAYNIILPDFLFLECSIDIYMPKGILTFYCK